MHAGKRSSFLGNSIAVSLLLIVLLMGSIPGAAAQTAGDSVVVVDGSPEAMPPDLDTAIDDEVVDDPSVAKPSVETAVSLVIPTIQTVSTENLDGVDPCHLFDSRWMGLRVQPRIDRSWIDPSTGLGGALFFEETTDPPSFGWDISGGGTIDGVIIPDEIDAAETLANFYDYRPYLGSISNDIGLTAPGGVLSIVYLCVPDLLNPVENGSQSPAETPALISTETIENVITTGSPPAPSPVDIAVRPATIGIGSIVKISEPLNLRESPGLSGTVRSVLAPGTVVSVIGGPQNASAYVWWQLSTPSGSGWSVVDYLIEQPVTLTPTASPIPSRTPTRTPTTNAGSSIAIGSSVQVRQRLNLRAQPGTSSSVVIVMPVGTLGSITAGPQTANGYQWWQLDTSLGSGWAAGSYLDIVAGTAIPTAPPASTNISTSTPIPSSTPSATATTPSTNSIGIGDLVQVTNRLNLRSAPSTSGSVITVLPVGSQWSVADGPRSANGYSWWQLDTPSGPGWVAGQYVARIGIAPTTTPTRTPASSPIATRTPTITSTPATCGSFAYDDIVRTTDSVNFRMQPTTSGTIIRTLATGERGSVKGGPVSANGYTWCQIQVGSTSGWTASLYLARVSGPRPTPNGTVTPRPSPPPPSGGSASVVYQGSASSGMIALTYDAGTDRGYAVQILDVLAQYGAHATFGMTGTWARDNPDLVQRMVDEGHQLINHTWDHPSFTGGSTSTTVLTRSGRLDQLDRAEAIVRQETGYEMSPYWRPPYGDINASVLSDVSAGGYYITVMWSCDTLGWNGLSEQQILNRCMYSSGAGSIILMHLASDSLDGPATDNMLQYFQNKGLQIVTIEELLGG